MKLLVFLIVIVIVVALLVIGLAAMINRESGSRKHPVRNTRKRYENQHRGYPVTPPSRESIEAKAPPPRQRPDSAPNGDQDRYDHATVDDMRTDLQKIAYEMAGNRHDEATKARFKKDMTAFAAGDPLVRLIATRVQQLVLDDPGQLQSKIYRHFPEFTKEQVRYGLYFADELGLVRREKKGNSYQLFPAGEVYE